MPAACDQVSTPADSAPMVSADLLDAAQYLIDDPTLSSELRCELHYLFHMCIEQETQAMLISMCSETAAHDATDGPCAFHMLADVLQRAIEQASLTPLQRGCIDAALRALETGFGNSFV